MPVLPREEQVPQALQPSQVLQFSHYGWSAIPCLPVMSAVHLLAIPMLSREHVSIHEVVDSLAEFRRPGAGLKIHAIAPSTD